MPKFPLNQQTPRVNGLATPRQKMSSGEASNESCSATVDSLDDSLREIARERAPQNDVAASSHRNEPESSRVPTEEELRQLEIRFPRMAEYYHGANRTAQKYGITATLSYQVLNQLAQEFGAKVPPCATPSAPQKYRFLFVPKGTFPSSGGPEDSLDQN